MPPDFLSYYMFFQIWASLFLPECTMYIEYGIRHVDVDAKEMHSKPHGAGCVIIYVISKLFTMGIAQQDNWHVWACSKKVSISSYEYH